MKELGLKVEKNGWGGKRSGSGRKPGPYAGSAKVTTVVLTAPLIDKLHKLGGSSWVREQIIKTNEDASSPKPESVVSLTSVRRFFNSDTEIRLSDCLVKNPEKTAYCLAEDNELKDKGIEAGDLLIVDRSLKPKAGDMVVVHTADGYSVRQFSDSDKIAPEDCNLFVQPNSEWRILGIIVFVVKQLSNAS